MNESHRRDRRRRSRDRSMLSRIVALSSPQFDNSPRAEPPAILECSTDGGYRRSGKHPILGRGLEVRRHVYPLPAAPALAGAPVAAGVWRVAAEAAHPSSDIEPPGGSIATGGR